jgi:hypothetical protein
MSGFEQGRDTVEKVAIFMICGWFLLKSVKDRFLGVDLLGQYVPPCVWYGTTCCLIRIALESGAAKGMVLPVNHMV